MDPDAITRLRRGQADERDRRILALLVERGLATPGDTSPKELLRRGRLSAAQLAAIERELREREVVDAMTPAPEEVRLRLDDPKARVGKFVLVRALGRGGMGEVWKAWDTHLSRWVAIKFILGDDPELLARFQREATLAAQLTHPGIARIYEVGESAGRRWIAMQFIDGTTLAHVPKNDRRRLVRILRDATLAVHAAHEQGIVHRDLKPANILVEDGTRPYVLDFGLARQIASDIRLSKSGLVLGTLAYMSPEQAMGRNRAIRPSTDVYGMGATLYELLTEEPPFKGETEFDVLQQILQRDPRPPRSLDPTIDADLETIALKCLEKDPARRYGTARELAEEFTRWLDGEPILARPMSTAYRLRRILIRRKAVIGVGAFGLAVAAVVAAILIPRWRAESRERKRREQELAERLRREESLRPHLDAGRTAIAQFDRLLMTPEWTQEEAKALAVRAEDSLMRALEVWPERPEALLEMARLWRLLERYDIAVRWCDRAIAASPEFATAYLERAILRLSGSIFAALVRHETPVWEAPQLRAHVERDLLAARTESAFAKGLFSLAEGKFSEAFSQLRSYCALDAADARGWLFLGVAAHLVNTIDSLGEATRALDRALAYRPRAPEGRFYRANARLGRGDLLIAAGRREEAVADWRAAEREYGELLAATRTAPCFDNRGSARVNLGDLDGAIADFSEAALLAPEWAEPLYNRGTARILQGKPAEALTDLDRAIRLNGKNPNAFANRGKAHLMRREPDLAVLDYDEAIRLRPNSSDFYFNRGVAHQAGAKLDRALDDYTRAIDLDGRNALARVGRATVYLETDDPDRALADCDEALKIAPKFPEALGNRGKARKARGDRLAAGGSLEGARAEWRLAVDDYRAALAAAPAGWPLRGAVEDLLREATERLK